MTKTCWEETVGNIDANEQPHFSAPIQYLSISIDCRAILYHDIYASESLMNKKEHWIQNAYFAKSYWEICLQISSFRMKKRLRFSMLFP